MTDLFWKPSCCIGDCDEMEDDDKIWGEEEIGSARNHYEKMSRAGTSTASAAPSNLFFMLQRIGTNPESSTKHPEKDRIDTIAKLAIKKENNGLFIRYHPLKAFWYKIYHNRINR